MLGTSATESRTQQDLPETTHLEARWRRRVQGCILTGSRALRGSLSYGCECGRFTGTHPAKAGGKKLMRKGHCWEKGGKQPPDRREHVLEGEPAEKQRGS